MGTGGKITPSQITTGVIAELAVRPLTGKVTEQKTTLVARTLCLMSVICLLFPSVTCTFLTLAVTPVIFFVSVLSVANLYLELSGRK